MVDGYSYASRELGNASTLNSETIKGKNERWAHEGRGGRKDGECQTSFPKIMSSREMKETSLKNQAKNLSSNTNNEPA